VQKLKPRILLVNDHIHFGGGGDAAFRFERLILEESGFEVFTFSHSDVYKHTLSGSDFICSEKKNAVSKKIGKFFCSRTVNKQLKDFIENIKPDLIHVHLVSKYPYSIYSALAGQHVIQTLHGPNLFCATSWGCIKKDSSICKLGIGLKCYFNKCVNLYTYLLYQQLYLRTKKNIQKNVSLFLGPSRQICRSASSLGFAAVEYFPLGIDRAFVDILPAPHVGRPTILYIGAIAEPKGVHFLLDAFLIVKQRFPEAQLVYAGIGEMLQKLRQTVAEHGLVQDVQFLGFVERSKVIDLYRSAHVVAVPSIWNEQFGLVGPEALACGVPCVASDIGGIPEWLHDNKWGYLVPPRDSIALAEKLCSLLNDRSLRLSFGAMGREFILREFGPDKYAENTLSLFEKLLS
jgi:glycosyltransferase involved in cell wall biosynthesis